MSTLKDLLPLLAVHGILHHLLPRVLLPMALQAAIRGLIIQVITCPQLPIKLGL